MADLGNLVSRLEVAVQKLEKIPLVSGSTVNASDDTPLWLDDYNKVYAEQWAPFLDETIAHGDDLKVQGELLKKAFVAHSNLLRVASSHNRPDEKDLLAVMKDLSDAISEVQKFREKNRQSKQFNFLSAISEGVPFLGWVTMSPKPAAYVVQMQESVQFYTNKVLKEFRQTEPKKADWSNNFIKLLKDFQQYVKDNHGTGLVWNKDKPKCTAASLSSKSAPPPPPPAGAPPPPPPPPPATAPSSGGGDQDATAAALFSAINKGADITKGLKKVTKDMQTHKTPDLRQQGPVSSSATNSSPRPYGTPQYKKFAPNNPPKKEPVFELQNKKWVIEHHDGNQNLTIDEEIAKEHTIYMFNCKNSILTVKNKCNSIVLDNCKKSAVVFEDLIAGCEFVNCQDVKAQVNGTVPMISIDKVDGINVFLNKKSITAQIVTAKSSEINITVMDDDEIGEVPLPEQYMTLWDEKKKKFVTTVNELNL